MTPGVPMPIRFGNGSPLSEPNHFDELGDLAEDMSIALLRFGGNTQPADRAVRRVGIEDDSLDLRAAEIDAPKMLP